MTFLTDEDFVFYLWALREASSESRCAVHAYVLMTNHVHLLLTPTDVDGPARLMMSIGRRYVPYFNRSYRRSGTLWEGRYRSSPITSVPYFFACSRYIELNPLRAGMVSDPIEYPWSSFHHNANGRDDPIITPHPQYMTLGTERVARCSAYRTLFASELPPAELAYLRAPTRERPPLQASPYQQVVDAMARRTTRVGSVDWSPMAASPYRRTDQAHPSRSFV